MGLPRVVAFTDTYLPTVNGVTYTVNTWRHHWEASGGQMDVVYPSSAYTPETGEHAVGSLALPFYDGFRVGTPQVPDGVRDADIVHAHTPFSLGVAGRRLARSLSVPLIASYHTPTAEYARYISELAPVERLVRETATSYEQWFLGRADAVITPSAATASALEHRINDDTPVHIVSNGVDTSVFRPVETDAFCDAYGLPDGVLVGYTGRHGHEKELGRLVEAVATLDDVTLVFGGDGPARERLEGLADSHDVRARFLGFLQREELPAFYSALDVFGFPSPVETEGLVALEAIACGTPVAGVDAGGLGERIEDGVTGYTAPPGDTTSFRTALERTIQNRDRLRESCLDRRKSMDVAQSLARLRTVYDDVRSRQPRERTNPSH